LKEAAHSTDGQIQGVPLICWLEVIALVLLEKVLRHDAGWRVVSVALVALRPLVEVDAAF